MNEIIEAFTIFLKYSDSSYPLSCEHDELFVTVSPDIVSVEDTNRLEELGFRACEYDCFRKFV